MRFHFFCEGSDDPGFATDDLDEARLFVHRQSRRNPLSLWCIEDTLHDRLVPLTDGCELPPALTDLQWRIIAVQQDRQRKIDRATREHQKRLEQIDREYANALEEARKNHVHLL